MKNDRRRPIRFKGYDWTELLQLQRIATNWPEVPKDFVVDEKCIETEEDQKAAHQMREYLGVSNNLQTLWT
jgi:hypothetical protein